MKKYASLLLFLFAALAAPAQKFPDHPQQLEARNKGRAILFHLTLGGHLPGGDLSKRFGTDQNLGSGLEWITAGNWIFGLEGNFFFSPTVKEDPIANLRTPDGDVIGNNQAIASVVLRERGIYAGALAGRLFTFGKKRSGLRVTLGAGQMQHWIRVQDDTRSVTQITGDYAKGYDRLTGGLALNEFVGWQHLGPNRNVNWFVGLEFNQGFTKSLRDWDFSSKQKLEGNRLDLRFGLRAGWTFAFYHKVAEKIYY